LSRKKKESCQITRLFFCGFAIVPALCGLGAVFSAFQFFYYFGDSKRIGPWAKPENYKK